jgi:sodium pump decarboxylase gamma subunit
MENMSLLEKFANPEIMPTLAFGDKMLATFYVTVLGMLITFSALILIWGLTVLLSKIVRGIENKGKAEIIEVKETPKATPVAEVVAEEDDEELIAVISAAIAASMNTSIHNIVVTNITRVHDQTPSWGVAGRSEQMNSRF